MADQPSPEATLRAQNKGVRELIEALESMGTGDEFGDIMGALFPLCAYLTFDRGDGVPDAWKFSPGAARSVAPEDREMIVAMFYPAYDTPTLLRFGESLRSRREACRIEGTDY